MRVLKFIENGQVAAGPFHWQGGKGTLGGSATAWATASLALRWVPPGAKGDPVDVVSISKNDAVAFEIAAGQMVLVLTAGAISDQTVYAIPHPI